AATSVGGPPRATTTPPRPSHSLRAPMPLRAPNYRGEGTPRPLLYSLPALDGRSTPLLALRETSVARATPAIQHIPSPSPRRRLLGAFRLLHPFPTLLNTL